ncbi:MAG: hypothetical protein JRI25_28180 [Deltaproteobacteria bacterium]|nr:hypothetical protein [Deltaproteobacteria bacterium]
MMVYRPALWLALSTLSLPAFAQDTGIGESPVDEEPGESPVDEPADEPEVSPVEPGSGAPPSGREADDMLPVPVKRSEVAPKETPPPAKPPPAEPPPAEPDEGTAEEAPADEVEPGPPPEPRAPRAGPGLFAGLHFGPAFALSPLSTSVLPRLEVGVELPWAQRRIRPFFAVAPGRRGHLEP